jgi:hypothetical protein
MGAPSAAVGKASADSVEDGKRRPVRAVLRGGDALTYSGRQHRGYSETVMAGHSKWANIQHRKGRQDAARSKLFSKLSKEITVAAKMGDPDPERTRACAWR